MGRSEDADGRSFRRVHLPLWLVLAVLAVGRGRVAPPAVPAASAVEDERDAVETAWRIHALLVDWIGKSDQKASFALAVESAAAIGIIAASDRDPRDPKLLSTLDTALELWIYRVGTVLLVVAIGLVMAAVSPQLRLDGSGRERGEGLVYFGDLRRWTEPQLSAALRERDMLPVLSDQLIDLSDIAWKKHRRLQWSLRLAGSGALLVALAAIADSNLLSS